MVEKDLRSPRELEQLMRPAATPGITFAELCSRLEVGSRSENQNASVQLSGVSMNPQLVLPGDLFLAIAGANRHGAEFAATALEHGAVAILTDQAGYDILGPAVEVPVAITENVRALAGPAARMIYGTTDGAPELFGVTGTNGKTTTTFMIQSLLEALSRPCGIVGTIEISARGQIIPSVLTTPEATQLHAIVANMEQQGVGHIAMEVSSHSLSYGRVDGLRFAVAGYTNLTQDHLDLHGSMEEYFATKAALFTAQRAQRAVVMVDDEYGQRLAENAEIPTLSLSLDAHHPTAQWRVQDVTVEKLGHRFVLRNRQGAELRAHTALPAMFNVANAALAVLMVHASGVALEDLQAALDAHDPLSVAVPGRMQVIGHEPVAVVDFAHNSDALVKALESMRPGPGGRRIVVFGATGERDKTKRPDMGRVAAEHADIVIVTDDDPHGEDPAPIREQVAAGARQAIAVSGRAVQLLNVAPRAAAIDKAVELAGVSDAILIAGRGHEVSQEVAGVDLELDDRTELSAALTRRGFVTVATHA
ncbi:UDP-N-acetylmuramoyl-L-alanyl-D-glutamate--2,6-diaminopimelate ligase [Glutamicibacter endophyticus]|uniref:UDP-N-acetylmuramoyl-L-alanyl-D-glutamate--2, 6-diaminopimelate ligase n=1 Tax=Glutamicibacter endophyticus TaxID=1522174 RepID=UPI003AF11481